LIRRCVGLFGRRAAAFFLGRASTQPLYAGDHRMCCLGRVDALQALLENAFDTLLRVR
jgi:hypothetical protein